MSVDDDGDPRVPEMHLSCLIARAHGHLNKKSDASTTTRK